MLTLQEFEGFKVEAGDPRYYSPGRYPAWVTTTDGRVLGYAGNGESVEDAGRRALDRAMHEAAGYAGALAHEDTPAAREAGLVYEDMKAAYESYCGRRKLQAYATWDHD